MRILVTGGSGFLGSHIVRLLCAADHSVRVTHRPGDDLRLLHGLAVEVMACDLLDEAGTRRAVEGVEAVIHVAALVTFQPRLYALQRRVNVEGTALLLQAARDAGVRRFLYTSTVNTLGIPEAGQVGDEQTPYNWQRWRLGYMESKRAAQELVLRAAATGLHALSVLPGTMFGPGDLNFNAGTYVRLCARGVLLAAPAGGTSVVHVEDVARGHLLALDRGATGERYILGGENLTYRQLFGLIAAEVGRRPPLFTLPPGPLRALGRIADRLHHWTAVRAAFSEGVAVAGASELFYSSGKAQRELGYSHRPARQAVADAVRWYRQQRLLG
jgi:dihydroflavonol-4-reductase